MSKLIDDDLMPFGKKYKGIPMKDVPVSYLHWMWHEVQATTPEIKDVFDYIYEHINVLKDENKDLIWSITK